MDLTCRCGSVSWVSGDDALIEGTADGRVEIDAGDEWLPGGQWECSLCHHVVLPKSSKQAVLDETVSRWLEAGRE
jgi:hypothetical protein